jgi:septal ring factor EnvC (AmiA/AmiB activator)
MLAAALAALAFAVGTPARAEISREQELARVRTRIGALEGELAALARRRESVEGELVAVAVEVRLQRERLSEARLAREEARSAAAALAVTVRESQARLSAQQRRLGERLVHLYRMGRSGSLRLLLAAREERSFLEAFRLVRYLALIDGRLLERWFAERQELARQARQLVEQRREAALWVDREVERLLDLEELQQRQAAMVADVERRSTAVRGEAERLVAREGQLARFLAVLAGTASLEGEPMQSFSGLLDPPVLGSVVRGYGPRLDPRYGTRVPHNGLEFVTLAGAEVRPVYPGRVLYAAPFEGYGLTVIVLHPGRVFSLYAGLRELRAAADDVLSFDRALGTSGGRLYFEIRVDNRPVDPAPWIR